MICLFFSHMISSHQYTEYILQTTRSNDDDSADISKDDRPLGKGKRYYIWYDIYSHIAIA